MEKSLIGYPKPRLLGLKRCKDRFFKYKTIVNDSEDVKNG
jgi:hypothetical protein